MKKVSIFFALLTTFTVITSQAIINLQDNSLEKSKENIALMENLFTSITQNFNPSIINKHEKNIIHSIDTYLDNILINQKNSNNTIDLEATATDFLNYLLANTGHDKAYAIASMMFMINWSKSINAIIADDTIEEKLMAESLQLALEKVSDLIEKIFLKPMTDMLEEEEI